MTKNPLKIFYWQTLIVDYNHCYGLIDNSLHNLWYSGSQESEISDFFSLELVIVSLLSMTIISSCQQ